MLASSVSWRSDLLSTNSFELFFFSALMAWFVTLASKMTGKEIPGVGKAPGGKIKKDVKEVEEHLNNFVAIAEAMQLHKANKWSFLAQYSINKMCADLCAMAADVVFHF